MALLLRLAAGCPLRLLHAFGAAVGWVLYGLSPRFRKYLRLNLAQAGFDDPVTRRTAITETGRAAFELPAIWLRPQAEAAGLVREVDGWRQIEDALAAGKGLILLTPHLGCWEVSAQYFAQRHPITVMYSPPKVRALEPLMRAGRTREGMKSVPADVSGVRSMFRALKRGQAIGMLPDQVPGSGEGEWVEFFGRPAYTMTLAARLSQASGARILVAVAERLPAARGYRIHIEGLPEPHAGESELRRMNRALEILIRRTPAQYLWAYNRYKVPAGVAAPRAQPGALHAR